MSVDRVKRVIRALQQKTTENGCSESEAMEAARKMGELLAEHELEMSEVGLKEEVSGATKNTLRAADDYASSVVVAISRFCTLVCYRSGPGQYVIFGMEHDLEIAKYLYEIVSYAMEDDWCKYMESHGYSLKKRESFRMGFANRVGNRLAEMKVERDRQRMRMSSSKDLMVVKDQLVKTEFDKLGIRLHKARSKGRVADPNAYRHGQAGGDRVNLNNPLSGGARHDQLR